jgi:hypothetical protein
MERYNNPGHGGPLFREPPLKGILEFSIPRWLCMLHIVIDHT